MVKKLTRLRIDEVSSVDRGAGEGVKILLRKREENEDAYPTINNAKQLQAAAQAVGRARDPDKLRAYIRARARALGLTPALSNVFDQAYTAPIRNQRNPPFKQQRNNIGNPPYKQTPPPFKQRNSMSKISKTFRKAFGEENDAIIDKSIEGLAESVASIATEASNPTELSTELTKTFEQFGDYLKETLTAGPAVSKKEVSNMDINVLAKALGLDDMATEAEVTEALAKSLGEVKKIKKMKKKMKMAKADLSDNELEFYEKIKGQKKMPRFMGVSSKGTYSYEAPGKDVKLPGERKAERKARRVVAQSDQLDGGKGGSIPRTPGEAQHKRFLLASKEERAEMMKLYNEVPEYVRKVMDDNETLQKRIEQLEGSSNLVALSKQATEAGLPATEGETIQKALKGDQEAINKLLGFVKAASEAAKAGGVFKEFGSSSGTGVVNTAYDELAVLAKDLVKRDPKLSFPVAFSKVYEDPANVEIVKRERGENRPN